MTTTHAPGELVRTVGSATTVGALVTESRTVTLSPGAVVGFTVDATRWCLGVPSLDGDDVPCPDGTTVTRGRRCPRCTESDPWRWLHIVHRSRYPPEPALREHVMRPHWLYVATFAGGAHKVGTAVDDRKHARLDEQGALVAHWIGLATDGIEVREWEDRVSTVSGIGQVVRPAAKVAGLAGPVSPAAVVRQHAETVARARQVLADVPGAEPLAEPWPNPRDPETLTGLTLRPYPGSLDDGSHGFTVEACWGPVGLVRLHGDPDSTWAVDLSALVGHRIRFGDHVTEVPQLQDSLF
ncbi:hypothetical protein ACQBAU_00220 [Propionibacteriaceae bacterium Y2011]